MERTWYAFDKRRDRRDLRLRLQVVICAAGDCRTVLHCDKKRGQHKRWCSDACRVRVRNRRIRQISANRQRGRRAPRYKGVLGTGHYSFGG